MSAQVAVRVLVVAVSAVIVAVVAPIAAADQVYHSQHLALRPVGGAPLRSGFVENIKTQGPRMYAHEVFVLNGAEPNATYTVTRNFFFLSPTCEQNLFKSDVAVLNTNAAGNAHGDVFVTPEEVEGFQGVHGVLWTVSNPGGAIVYQTDCTAVTLD